MSFKSVINNQMDEIWSELTTQLFKANIDNENIFQPTIKDFLLLRATSIGTNISYLFLSALIKPSITFYLRVKLPLGFVMIIS